MKVLLSGASGFLGSNILKHFKELGYTVDTIGRSSTNSIVANLSDFNSIIEKNYDLVVHAAGKAHIIPKNQIEEKMFYDVNLKGTKNLLKALISPPKHFIFISTVAVYGLDYGLNIKEEQPLNANTPYGKSKVLAEKEVLAWSKANGVRATILRLPLIIGHNPKGNLLSMINGIKKGYYFNIGAGSAKKSMVLIDDVALSITTLMHHPNIYNLTDGYNPSFKEISNKISEHFGIKRVLSVHYFFIKPIAICGDLVKKLFFISPLFDSNKLNKITKSLTFDDSKSRSAGWIPRKVLENKSLWLK